MPYEIQNDIYTNDKEAFESLSNEIKKQFLAKIKRKKLYPDGGTINQPNKEPDNEDGAWANLKQFGSNFIKSPFSAMYDAALWTADKIGAPSNVTNFLRDIPNAIRYKLNALPAATLKALVDFAQGNGFTLEESYNYYLKNPSILQQWNSIEPLPNNNDNYSTEELKVIKNMAGNKSNITNADIKRVSGRYGGQGSIFSYVTEPDKVVQTSIGQTSGRNGHLHDIFDTNVSSKTAQSDNNLYMNKAIEQPGLNYYGLRALMPYIGSTDVMPNNYKIHTYIDLNDIKQ